MLWSDGRAVNITVWAQLLSTMFSPVVPFVQAADVSVLSARHHCTAECQCCTQVIKVPNTSTSISDLCKGKALHLPSEGPVWAQSNTRPFSVQTMFSSEFWFKSTELRALTGLCFTGHGVRSSEHGSFYQILVECMSSSHPLTAIMHTPYKKPYEHWAEICTGQFFFVVYMLPRISVGRGFQ